MSVFDKLYDRYDRWYENHWDVFLKEVETVKKIGFKGKGIEIGVGTGRFAQALGIQYGIDPSANMLKIARSRNIKVKKGVGENLPYKDLSFDFAVLIVTICFVENPIKVLHEINRILKKGGKVIVGIVDKKSSLGKLYLKKDSPFYGVAKFYSSDEVMDFFKDTGFKYEKSYELLISRRNKIKEGYKEGDFIAISGIKK